MKRVALELGGNNSFIVLEDADLEAAFRRGLGHVLSPGPDLHGLRARHIVHESDRRRVPPTLAERAGASPRETRYRGGRPRADHRQDGSSSGSTRSSMSPSTPARAGTGGKGDPPYFRPTVLADVTPEMPAWHEEIFGPVAPVMASPTSEAIAIAKRDTQYGLSRRPVCAAWTRARRSPSRFQTGLVHIKDQTVNYESYISVRRCRRLGQRRALRRSGPRSTSSPSGNGSPSGPSRRATRSRLAVRSRSTRRLDRGARHDRLGGGDRGLLGRATDDAAVLALDGRIAPPVFAIVGVWTVLQEAAQAMAPAETRSRVVHGDQDIQISAPIAAGMTLVSRATPVIGSTDEAERDDARDPRRRRGPRTASSSTSST